MTHKTLIFFLVILTLSHCVPDPKIKLPDITSDLTFLATFDTSSIDIISGVYGTLHKCGYGFDRKGVNLKAIYLAAGDSAYVDFGDIEGASFTDNIFTIGIWYMLQDSSLPFAMLSKRGVTGPWEYSIDNHFDTAHFSFDNWVENGAGTVYGTDPLQASAPTNTWKWHHLAYVADGRMLRVYFDGKLIPFVDQVNNGKFLSNTTAPLKLGNGGNWGKNLYFTGAIDEVRMYHRALTAEEVKLLAK